VSKGDSASADQQKTLALENLDGRTASIYKSLIQDLKTEN
jgi:hypothetical protein